MNETERKILLEVIASAIKNERTFYDTRHDELAKRLSALEQREPNVKYTGVYKSGQLYRRGHFVTHSGSVWHCDDDTTETPGQSNSWTLAVKRGKDAKAAAR